MRQGQGCLSPSSSPYSSSLPTRAIGNFVLPQAIGICTEENAKQKTDEMR